MKIFEIFLLLSNLFCILAIERLIKIFESFSIIFNFFQTTYYLLIETRFKAQTSQSAEDI